MMNEGTLGIWMGGAPGVRPPWTSWALGVLAGAVLGSAITALAVERTYEARAASEAAATAPEWRHRALDREWRGIRTPVDVDRMFRKRG